MESYQKQVTCDLCLKDELGFLREEKLGMGVERESPGRNKALEAWKSTIYAGNSTQLSVAGESVTLNVIDTFLCVQVSGRRSATVI